MIVAYEVGTVLFARDSASGTETRIVAFTLFRDFLSLFGATGGAAGHYLPGLAVIGLLLSLHLVRHDPWKFRLGVQLGMLAECFCWTVPLVALAMLLGRYLPTFHSIASIVPWLPTNSVNESGIPLSLPARIVLSIGAGIYEELVFRLIAFALLSFLISDVLGVPKKRSVVAVFVISSVFFSLYHYLGSEQPAWYTFVFRTAAGMFFGALYLSRGFGITAGSHAFYDVVVNVLP
jgi:membrane protease YdiL (CAAX protease family)